jgi:hypothetical protein
MNPTYSSRTTGRCLITVEIDLLGGVANITGHADYTVTDGDAKTYDNPGSPAEVEFSGFSADEVELCWSKDTDNPDSWVYMARDDLAGGAHIYDSAALTELQSDPEKYGCDAYADAADRAEDTRW